jgi:hypothetical protein
VITRRAFVLAPLGLAFGQSADSLRSGFLALYHLRFVEAREAFLAWQRAHPEDPMGLVSEAAAYLFEEFEAHDVLTVGFFLDDDRLLGGIRGKADRVRTQAFEDVCERARALARSQWTRSARDANALLALTLSTGLRADYLSIIEKSQIASLREIRAAEDYGDRLLKLAPAMADAYVALGAANYILACLPSYKRAVLWFGGMQGDKKRGLDQLARAARDGNYLAPYAKILLALALLREKRGPEARGLVRELTTTYPQSPLFARELAAIEARTGIK